MDAFDVGELAGTVLASLVVPVLLMIGFKLMPSTRNSHKLVYGVPGAIGVAFPFLGAKGLMAVAASAILMVFFLVGYLRATRR